jgi:curved DNA-binding protein CbpA
VTDPYKLLGVRRNASAKSIRSAYHKKARETHPDSNPGDETAPDRFDAVRRAYELLSDPVRRKKYDETGDAAEPRPVNGSGFDFVDILARTLDDCVQAAFQNGTTGTVDLVEAVRRKVTDVRRKVETDVGGMQKSLAAVRKAVGRIKTPDGQVNLLEEILKRKVADHETMIAAATGELDRLTRALDYLKDCKCDGTKPASDPLAALGGWTTMKLSW